MADTKAPVAPELLPLGTWTTNPRVNLATNLGSFAVELAPNAAIFSTVNFLAYVNTGFYKDLLFHRVIPGFVAQGGGFAKGLVYQSPFYAPIPLESNNGLSNRRGTIAMARSGNPNSATSQFYINLVNNPDLDFSSVREPGYAVFGRVVQGMGVVDRIARVRTGSRGGFDDVPVSNVLIKDATQTVTGTVHNKTGLVYIGGIEARARWEYSFDGGDSWTRGDRTFRFRLPKGGYEAQDILARQTDVAGNVSAVGLTGASVVVHSGNPILGNAAANALTGTSKNDALFGLAGADRLAGGAGNDQLDGGSGKDTMIGGAGNDTYYVRDAADVVREGVNGGTDTVLSFLPAYTLPANVERGRIMASGSADLTGNALDNLLVAGQGDNTLTGGDGMDTVSYATGVRTGQGVVVDLNLVGPQDTGGSGIDTLVGIENLIGSPFDDILIGDAQDNVLTGGAGADVLTGGDGNDIFRFNTPADMGRKLATADVITDFTLGDLLDLSGLDANTRTAANDAFRPRLVDAFTAPGQLRFADGVLYGNTDANPATAEFLIVLRDVTSLSITDIVL